MKVDPTPGLQLLARGASSISFPGDGDFASKLTLGQIIKGRVLRSYEGSRHLVDFAGQQKVVDSAVPLRPDEVIYGRVIGLGEKVELQRVNANVTAPATATAAAAAPALTGKSGELIAGLLERFQAQLSPAELSMLQRLVERAPQAEQMAMSGLVLSKLGVPISPAALRAVFEALRTDPAKAMFALPGQAIELATRPATADAVAPPTAAFATLLSELLRDVPESQRDGGGAATTMAGGNAAGGAMAWEGALAARNSGSSNGGTARDNGRRDSSDIADVARLILNVQSGGAIAHRVGTLPLLVDGKLVELNIALFEQNDARQGDEAQAHRHRQVVFAVTTEALGRVEVRAAIAGTHIRLAVSTEVRDSAQFLARHAGRLTTDLETLGWQIDELVYETTPVAAPGVVARTLIEHLVAPGSVSALA